MTPESLRASIAYHPCLYEVLREVCSNLRPVSYLEIGVKEGDSLLTVLEASEGSVRKLTLCDIWKGEGGYGHLSHEHIELLLRELNFSGDVEFLDGDSRDTIPTLSGPYDLILIDGDHSMSGAQVDLKNTWPLLRVGGVLVYDDIGHSAHPHLEPVFKQWSERPDAKVLDMRYDRSSGTAFCRKVKTLVMQPNKPEEPKTAVVLRFGGFGDVLWATPVFRKLKEDGYKVILHTFSYAAPIVERDPNIDEIYVHPIAQVARQITMPPNSRVVDLIHLGHLLEGGYYFGCAMHSQAFEIGCESCELLKQQRDEDLGNVNYEENILVRADQRENPYCPSIYFTDEEIKDAHDFVQSEGWSDKFIVFWSAASTIEHKIYPYWYEVCEEFTRAHEDTLVYSVGNKETQGFQASGERIIPIAGDWKLRKSILLGTMADLIIGTETGYMNAVAHYDVPKIALLSHSSPNNLTKNWKNTTTLSPDVPCHPCHQMHFSKASCPISYIEVSKPEIRAK